MPYWQADSSGKDPARTLMSGSGTHASTGMTGAFFGHFMGRRRSYLVDSRYQIKTALVAVLGMIFLLAFAAALFHFLTLENARLVSQRVPGLARGSAGDARSVLYLVAAGIIFVAAVFVVEILETHKTAGVVFKVTRGLQEIAAGRWGARVVLRKHDNFKELEETFNSATRSLRDRVEADLQGLQAIEGQIRLVAREFESGNREGALVLLRQVAGEMQTWRERRRDMLRSDAPDPSQEAAARF